MTRASHLLLALAGTIALGTLLSGCALQTTAAPSTSAVPEISGMVHGGQQPVSYSAIQLYSAGTTGYASAATPLIPSGSYYLGGARGCVASGSQTCYPGIISDSTGSFVITGDYTCPSAASQVYIVATGGNPGLTAGTNNSALALMSALGSCGNLGASTAVIINEVTTVAAVWSLQQFMTDVAHIGTSSTNAYGLANAFNNANTIVGVACGCAFQSNFNAYNSYVTYNLPQNAINSLANALATCVNSNGSTSSGSGCSQLFLAATPSGGTAPANTIGAALDIASNPAGNVAAVFALSSATAPFQPTYVVAPGDWTLALSHYSSAGEALHGTATDANGNFCYIITDSSGDTSGCGYSTFNGNFGVTYDAANDLWVSNSNELYEYSSGNLIATYNNPARYGLVDFDSSGNLWSVGSSGLYIFSPSGALLASSLADVDGIADGSGGMWELSSYTTLFRASITGSTVQLTTYTGPSTSGFIGVALDTSSNTWLLNNNSTLTKLTPSGSAYSVTATASGGGLNTTGGGSFALDGRGSVWVANRPYTGTSNQPTGISAFSNNGAALSPANGYNPYAGGNVAAFYGIPPIQNASAISIDKSGDVTVLSAVPLGNSEPLSSFDPNPLIQTTLLGLAAPVIVCPACAAASNKVASLP